MTSCPRPPFRTRTRLLFSAAVLFLLPVLVLSAGCAEEDATPAPAASCGTPTTPACRCSPTEACGLGTCCRPANPDKSGVCVAYTGLPHLDCLP